MTQMRKLPLFLQHLLKISFYSFFVQAKNCIEDLYSSLDPPFVPVVQAPTCLIYFQAKIVTFSNPICIKNTIFQTNYFKCNSVKNLFVQNILSNPTQSKSNCLCQMNFVMLFQPSSFIQNQNFNAHT